MTVEIEKNIPIPEGRGFGSSKYPFAKMEIGDSFSMPIQDRSKVSNSASMHIKRFAPDKKFTTKRIDDSTVRIWRIK